LSAVPIKPPLRVVLRAPHGGVRPLAVTAGASARESLAGRVLDALHVRHAVALEPLATATESMPFPPASRLAGAGMRGAG
jgi:hypothetical protein